MSKHQTSKHTHSAISSQELAAGRSRSELPDGLQTDLFGLAPAPASRSAAQGKGEAKKTPGTFGRSFDASSPSAILQQSLVNRLRRRMAVYGSPEYVLTWKSWDMPSGPPICALRASGHRTSDKGCGGWGTPRVVQGDYCYASGDHNRVYLTVNGQARAAAQAAGGPNARDSNGAPHLSAIAHGQAACTSPVQTERRGQLNPDLPRWLMGYPVEWGCCGATAMQSCRKSQRSS